MSKTSLFSISTKKSTVTPFFPNVLALEEWIGLACIPTPPRHGKKGHEKIHALARALHLGQIVRVWGETTLVAPLVTYPREKVSNLGRPILDLALWHRSLHAKPPLQRVV